jgi:hypothetical protein
MEKTRLVRNILFIGLGAGVLAFSVLMLTKILPYFSFERGIHFLSTKSDKVLDNPVFLTGFYLHITSSLWVMAAGVFQFIPGLFHRSRSLHQNLGKLYILSILLLAAPSGLILAFYANGGLPSKVGFTMQCIVWWFTTLLAWKEILDKQWLSHVEWMIRSFAITLAAMSLRLESYVMYYFLETKPIETYLTVTWLSWTGNLLIAEIVIRFGVAKRLLQAVKITYTSKLVTHNSL